VQKAFPGLRAQSGSRALVSRSDARTPSTSCMTSSSVSACCWTIHEVSLALSPALVLTLPVDVGCLSFYEFWERENSLQKKVRCGNAMKSVCSGSVVQRDNAHTCTHPPPAISAPSRYSLAFPRLTFSPVESFPSPKNRKNVEQPTPPEATKIVTTHWTAGEP